MCAGDCGCGRCQCVVPSRPTATGARRLCAAPRRPGEFPSVCPCVRVCVFVFVCARARFGCASVGCVAFCFLRGSLFSLVSPLHYSVRPLCTQLCRRWRASCGQWWCGSAPSTHSPHSHCNGTRRPCPLLCVCVHSHATVHCAFVSRRLALCTYAADDPFAVGNIGAGADAV